MDINNIQPDTGVEQFSALKTNIKTAGDTVSAIEGTRQRNEDAENATWGEKAVSFGYAFRQENGTSGMYDYLAHDTNIFGEKDPEFMKTWDLKSQNEFMSDASIPDKYHNRLSKAESNEHLASISEGVFLDMAMEEDMMKHLTATQQFAGNASGMMIDYDVFIPLAKAKKAESLMKAMMKPVTLQASYEVARNITDEHYTLSDAIIGVAGFSLISAGLGARQLKLLNEVNAKNTFLKIDPEQQYKWSVIGRKESGKMPTVSSTVDDIFKWSATDPRVSKMMKALDEPLLIEHKAKVGDGFEVTKKLEEPNSIVIEPVKPVDIVDGISKLNKNISISLSNMLEDAKQIIKDAEFDGSLASNRQYKEISTMIDIVRKESGDAGHTLDQILAYKMKPNKSGNTFQFVNSKGKPFGRKIPAVIALGLIGGTSAQASEGEGISSGMVGYTFLALVASMFIGHKALREYQREGSFYKMAHSGYRNAVGVQDGADILANNKAWGWMEKQSMIVRTQITETYAQFAKAGGQAKKMADEFLVNYADGRPKSAEIEKRRIGRIAEAEVARIEETAFKEWQQEIGSTSKPLINFLQTNRELGEFRNLVTNAIDGVGTGAVSPSVAKVAEEMKLQIKKIGEMAGEEGVLGYGKGGIKLTDDYIPRYHRTGHIRQLITGSNATENRKALQTAYAQMMEASISKSRAEKLRLFDEQTAVIEAGGMVEKKMKKPTFKNTPAEESMVKADALIKHSEGEHLGKRRMNDASLARLEKQMEEQGMELTDEMRALFDSNTDKTGRALWKIGMDYNSFKPFKAIIDGKEVEITLGHLIDRDAKSIISRYANEMGGQIALAKKGYKTVKRARDGANLISDLRLRSAMNKVVDSLAGEEMLVMGDTERKIFEAMTGVAFTAKLPLVTVSMLTELAKVVSYKNGLLYALNDIAQKMHLGKNPKSHLVTEIQKATGQGTASLRHEVNVRGIDDIGNTVEDMGSAFGEIGDAIKQGKEASSRLYGLLAFSDWLQNASSALNAQRLTDFVHGKGKISATRMKQYGITESNMDELRKHLTPDENGELLALNYDKWSKSAQEEFTNIMYRMNQNLSQETSLGGTGLYMHNSLWGKSMSYLLTFPAEAFSNHGLRDMATGDLEASKNFMAMFMGTYISLKVRYAVTNQEVSDEEVLYRAVTQMPIFGIVNVATGVTDPVVLDAINNMTSVAKLSNYEDLVVGDK